MDVTVRLTFAEGWEALTAVVQRRADLERLASRLRGLPIDTALDAVEAGLTRVTVLETTLRAQLEIPREDAPMRILPVSAAGDVYVPRAVGESESMDRELAGGR